MKSQTSNISYHMAVQTSICALICLILFIPQFTASPDIKPYLFQRDGLHVPCSFFDTVNITGDPMFANGSYLHDGVLIPPHLVGRYDYIYKDLVTREDVSPHLRGCICKLKPCINLCCPWGTIFNPNISECRGDTERTWPEPKLNLTFANGTVERVDIFQQFVVKRFRPCDLMFPLQPELYDFDGWNLYENGSMLRLDDGVLFSKQEFCFLGTLVNDTDLEYIINPANCKASSSEYGTMKIINAYAMMFSIPFMVLTIAVYLIVPELRNHHGKSLVSYLIGMVVGYSFLCVIVLVPDLENLPCKLSGYIAYYFFMSAFLWLSVISFDLWHNFRGTRGVNRFHEKKRFLGYSLYAWGLAAIFLVFTFCMEEFTDLPTHLKPGIGNGEFCWLDMLTWSAMIYFFGPILIIIVCNLVMFIMTALKIHHVQREMSRIMAREDSTKNLRSEKDKFGLFLRLFIVMGVTWSTEIISYFVGADKAWSKAFYISDICNAMQGFLIFLLFVMKKKVKELITNRYSSVRYNGSQQRQSQYSTKTTSSSVANLTLTAGSNTFEKPLMTPQERTTYIS